MKIEKPFILIFLLSSILCGCGEGRAFMEFPEGLSGGLYELSPSGTKMSFYDGSKNYSVDKSDPILLGEIHAVAIRKIKGIDYYLELHLLPGIDKKLARMTERNMGDTLVFALNDVIYTDGIVVGIVKDRRMELLFRGVNLAETLFSIFGGESVPVAFAEPEVRPEEILVPQDSISK